MTFFAIFCFTASPKEANKNHCTVQLHTNSKPTQPMKRTTTVFLAGLLSACLATHQADAALIAHYDFGDGNLFDDETGNGYTLSQSTVNGDGITLNGDGFSANFDNSAGSNYLFTNDFDDVSSVVAEFDTFINREDFTVFADVKGPTFGEAAEAYGIFFYQTVSDGCFAGGVTEDWVIQPEGLCKFLVGLFLVTARGEVGELIGFDFFADLTERHAFGFSSAGKGLGKPGDDDGFFVLKIRSLVNDSIAAHQFKIRSDVAHLVVLVRGRPAVSLLSVTSRSCAVCISCA